MSKTGQGFSNLGFAKTFLLPALSVFLIPVLTLLFFLHAQSLYDGKMREAWLQNIQANPNLTPQQRQEQMEFVRKNNFSNLLLNEQFAAQFAANELFDYIVFRWMIRISALSIACGVGAFVLAGVCVAVSYSSQMAQYLSLLASWHVLRIYGALQTLAIGAMLVALSYYVTAVWFNIYIIKIIAVIGLVSIGGVFAVIMAIFKNPKSRHQIEGSVLAKDASVPLWHKLETICTKVGAAPPDQVIVGIDDNFFVTERPIHVAGKQYEGKTLFVSLALLKHLHATEADAVLAHEMAHFSGQDTVYSKRISPLLLKYEVYLQSLHDGLITLPIYYFMLGFRALFELSLGSISRKREYRADAIATQVTSPRDMAAALLRIVAYSKFRQKVQEQLFREEQALETANVSERIEHGFPEYAVAFAADPSIGELESVHPFDSHPSLSQRLEAIGVRMSPEETRSLLAHMGDGAWRGNIPNAKELEQQQWDAFEKRFRDVHEESLPYRFLPCCEEEQLVVEKAFPPQTFEGKEGMLTIDFEKVHHALWRDPIRYGEITKCELSEQNVLTIHFSRSGKQSRTIKIAKFTASRTKDIVPTIERYYGRYLAAIEYQKMLIAEEDAAKDEVKE